MYCHTYINKSDSGTECYTRLLLGLVFLLFLDLVLGVYLFVSLFILFADVVLLLLLLFLGLLWLLLLSS